MSEEQKKILQKQLWAIANLLSGLTILDWTQS